MSSTKCAVCWKDGGKLCTTCKSCHYCSKECQSNDWKSHKLLCEAIVTQPNRPSPAHVRAILFPDDKPTPELVWVPCRPQHISSEPNIPEYNAVRDLVVTDSQKDDAVFLRIDYDYRHNESKYPDRLLEIWHRSHHRSDGSTPTTSYYKTVKPHGKTQLDWRGPLLAFGIATKDPLGDDDQRVKRYADAILADLRGIVDHAVCYHRDNDNLIKDMLELSSAGVRVMASSGLIPSVLPRSGKKQDDGRKKGGKGDDSKRASS
ncbi:uncharacterized protein F4822DRAFT_378535 [Hypoxylon trugodes]|uniref:uncharacterized protein n=1 Tax=Hypoxylon trugodes TaxID=326681 RepID=UPI002196C58F|nr:uncharacterized protein F4822DRAFT_378535 [Hypoxylon trugodes]KAI1384954.1 hypothetical protein F4822DRAFT_378535 [Hypoxylon trugodes]